MPRGALVESLDFRAMRDRFEDLEAAGQTRSSVTAQASDFVTRRSVEGEFKGLLFESSGEVTVIVAFVCDETEALTD
jgi:hypothetical protein